MKFQDDIKVSVILAVFNVENYIQQCLDSILGQTLKDIEIILIDDCSTDNSAIICEEYAKKDKRIIIIHNKTNIRQGLSRNKGIEIAHGKYIGFVDPDDWVDKDYYERLFRAAEYTKSNIAKAEVTKVFENESTHAQPSLNRRIQNNMNKGVPLCLLFDYEHGSGIYKRDILVKNRVKYANIRNAEDNFFLLQATFFLKSITIVHNTNYYYRQHKNSIEFIREKDYYESILHCSKLHMEFINNRTIQKDLYDKIFMKAYEFAKEKYKEIIENPKLENYKEEYISQLFTIMLMYKYNIGHLLSSYNNGFLILNTNQEIINSKTYLIAKALTWLPRQALKLIT